jgi:TRAP-type C4-dicarboxylate transport system permease small subunit
VIDTCLHWLDRISVAAAAVAALCLAAMAAFMLAEVVARSFLATSLVMSWEYSGYLMGAAFFFGAAYTLRTGGHVRVSILAEALPPRAAWVLDFAATLAGIAVAGFLLHALFGLAQSSWQRSILSFTPMRTPLIVPQGLLVLGALLLFAQFVARLVRLLRGDPPEVVPDLGPSGPD